MGLRGGFKDLRTLFEVAKTKGKPINDRDMTVSTSAGRYKWGDEHDAHHLL
jgi:hypothetical protein